MVMVCPQVLWPSLIIPFVWLPAPPAEQQQTAWNEDLQIHGWYHGIPVQRLWENAEVFNRSANCNVLWGVLCYYKLATISFLFSVTTLYLLQSGWLPCCLPSSGLSSAWGRDSASYTGQMRLYWAESCWAWKLRRRGDLRCNLMGEMQW